MEPDIFILLLAIPLVSGALLTVLEDETGTFIFNSRDLCALPILDQVVGAGVQSLKVRNGVTFGDDGAPIEGVLAFQLPHAYW